MHNARTRQRPPRKKNRKPAQRQRKFSLKTADQIEKLRIAGRTVAETLYALESSCKPGTTTMALDHIAALKIKQAGGTSLFFGYPNPSEDGPPFPAHLCISVNDEVVHGIPSPACKLQAGDLVSIDCGIRVNGWCGDSAVTFVAGGREACSPENQRLLDTTQAVLERAIAECRPGRWWSEIAKIIEDDVNAAGYGNVTSFVGHGIGQELHEAPQVPHYVSDQFRQKEDFKLEPGLVFCVEPMLTRGQGEVEVVGDDWTVVTADGEVSAHFEHMVAITADGADVLTRLD